jgi:hypothetical protein
MTTTEPIDMASAERPNLRPERPERPIVATGDKGEINRLVQAGQNRTLTDAERLRLAAMTYTTNETLERARLIRDRHPDLYQQIPSNFRTGLEKTYEPNRAAAIAAGRTVADPGPGVVAEIDELAALYRETREIPGELVDIDRRHRAAFREAIRRPDFDAALREWAAWRADQAALDAFNARRAEARRGFGQNAGDGTKPRLRFLVELERAVGGQESFPVYASEPGAMVGPPRDGA